MPESEDNRPIPLVDDPARRLEQLRSNLKIIAFSELCRCGEEVWIENEGELYRLRKTRQGKLILTK